MADLLDSRTSDLATALEGQEALLADFAALSQKVADLEVMHCEQEASLLRAVQTYREASKDPSVRPEIRDAAKRRVLVLALVTLFFAGGATGGWLMGILSIVQVKQGRDANSIARRVSYIEQERRKDEALEIRQRNQGRADSLRLELFQTDYSQGGKPYPRFTDVQRVTALERYLRMLRSGQAKPVAIPSRNSMKGTPLLPIHPEPPKLNLRYAQLQPQLHGRPVQLQGHDLSEVNLSDSNLTGANLTDAKLVGSWLGHANLERAVLHRANLTGARLRSAHMVGCDLRKAILHNVNFKRANLANCNIGSNGSEHPSVCGAQNLHLASPPEIVAQLEHLNQACNR